MSKNKNNPETETNAISLNDMQTASVLKVVDSMKLEGTLNNPKNFKVSELEARVDAMNEGCILLTGEPFSTEVYNLILDLLRTTLMGLGRLVMVADHSTSQRVLKRVLDPRNEKALVGSLVEHGRYEVTLSPDEHKMFIASVKKDKDSRGYIWKVLSNKVDEKTGRKYTKYVSYNPNFS